MAQIAGGRIVGVKGAAEPPARGIALVDGEKASGIRPQDLLGAIHVDGNRSAETLGHDVVEHVRAVGEEGSDLRQCVALYQGGPSSCRTLYEPDMTRAGRSQTGEEVDRG